MSAAQKCSENVIFIKKEIEGEFYMSKLWVRQIFIYVFRILVDIDMCSILNDLANEILLNVVLQA